MTGATGTSRALGRREHEQLSLRRQRAELRLSRERARNAHIALAGFVGLAILLGVGIKNGWMPMGAVTNLSSAAADARQFTETHTGHIRFTSDEGIICRELQFNNDTGQFNEGKPIRCDGAADSVAPPPEAPPAAPSTRALSIRDGFTKP
jgi:hypothetical protein